MKKQKSHKKNLYTQVKDIIKNDCNQFQKMWIYIFSILLVFSLIMTVFQSTTLILSAFSSTSKKTSAASTPSASASIEAGDSVILQETADAGQSYIDNTLFLGDSNTVRFMSYTNTEGITYTSDKNTIAVVGMGVDAINTLECEKTTNGTLTMVEAAELLQPMRIMITFGTNNLDGKTEDPTGFITAYTEKIKEIQTVCPNAHIIINSIFPISEKTVYTNLSINQIKIYNEAIIQMCTDNGWHYLNSFEALADSTTGYAISGYTDTDGLHLSEKGLAALFTYIRTHAYLVKDEAEYALSNTDSIIEPLTTLYTTDPLSGGSYDDSVLHPTEAPTAVPTPTAEQTQTCWDGSVIPASEACPIYSEEPVPSEDPVVTPENPETEG